MTQTAVARTIIPANADIEAPSEGAAVAAGPDLKGAIYAYEPDESGILEVLLPRNINSQVFAALLENQAGEMGSKMTAMDNATRNAGDMLSLIHI